MVFRNFPYHILLVVAIRAFDIHPFGDSNLFCGDCQIFYHFFLGLVLACFGCKIGLLHQFVFARFGLFVYFLAVMYVCPFDTFTHKHFASLNHPKLFLLPSLFGFLTSPKLA